MNDLHRIHPDGRQDRHQGCGGAACRNHRLALERRHPQMIARKEAKSLGLKRYNTGKPCKHGHLCDRYVACCVCVLCADINAEKWRKINRSLVTAKSRWRRLADREARRVYEKRRYAIKTGKIIVPKNIPQTELKPGECKAVVQRKHSHIICCGATTVAQSAWCSDHHVDVEDAVNRLKQAARPRTFMAVTAPSSLAA